MSLSPNTTVYNALMKKLEAGEPLTEKERKFVRAYQKRDPITAAEDTVHDVLGWLGL